jgi:hypothetical protein
MIDLPPPMHTVHPSNHSKGKITYFFRLDLAGS